ncbi:hypothetical protein H8N03_06590 [Ramlibacter sp. USB13]|uniref:DUF4124 domain-containing protein n=1 Tax=Ramlibacter cellulosilyticus TaxID=2764187 RepID=A0A923SAB4_9BURK|nr:hypothetical protein [Ramlibacter cellulosilyticus]MBC5782606.1 hypothetical protein [Ramlibacter cellulosilyticus]
MGLQDRDYMRERNRNTLDRMLRDMDRPFTPPQAPSLFTMTLACIAVGFALYQAYDWWTAKNARRKQAQPVVERLVEERPSATPLARPGSERVPSPSEAARVVAIPTQPPAPEPAPQARTGGTIYHCKDYSGGTFWASNHCHEHRALIDRIASVPAGLPFEQQVQIAEAQRHAGQQLAAPPAYVQAPPSQASQRRQLCESLDARVNQFDAMARQPQSAQTQDWIRAERHKTRDEQFRLRC